MRKSMANTNILGISAFYHDSAACLLRDGEIVGAAQEERFTRKKGDASFPTRAVEYCLRVGGIKATDLAFVGFYDKPLLKFERILETYLAVAPRGFGSFLTAAPVWLKDKLFLDRQLRNALGYEGEVLYAEPHESHAASAFFPSPFDEAAILTWTRRHSPSGRRRPIGDGNSSSTERRRRTTVRLDGRRGIPSAGGAGVVAWAPAGARSLRDSGRAPGAVGIRSADPSEPDLPGVDGPGAGAVADHDAAVLRCDLLPCADTEPGFVDERRDARVVGMWDRFEPRRCHGTRAQGALSSLLRARRSRHRSTAA